MVQMKFHKCFYKLYEIDNNNVGLNTDKKFLDKMPLGVALC